MVVTHHAVHVIRQELFFFFGIHYEPLHREFFVTVHTAHKFTILIGLGTSPAGNSP